MAHPFAQEQYADPGPRLRQLQARRTPARDAHGMEVYQSSYGWIGAQISGNVTVLKFYQSCPCND